MAVLPEIKVAVHLNHTPLCQSLKSAHRSMKHAADSHQQRKLTANGLFPAIMAA